MRHIAWTNLAQILLVLVALIPVHARAAGQRSEGSIQIHKYLDEMKALTATPWSVNDKCDLVGRPDDKAMVWNSIAENMSKAILASHPTDIDAQIIDDLVGQACDPWGWENSDLHAALGHIGERAISQLVDVIEATPPDGNRPEYFSRGLADVLTNTKPENIEPALIDKIATGLNNPDRATRIHFAEALGAIGPPAKLDLPILERLFQRELDEDKKWNGVMVGIWAHDVVRWQIEKITGMPHTGDR